MWRAANRWYFLHSYSRPFAPCCPVMLISLRGVIGLPPPPQTSVKGPGSCIEPVVALLIKALFSTNSVFVYMPLLKKRSDPVQLLSSDRYSTWWLIKDSTWLWLNLNVEIWRRLETCMWKVFDLKFNICNPETFFLIPLENVFLFVFFILKLYPVFNNTVRSMQTDCQQINTLAAVMEVARPRIILNVCSLKSVIHPSALPTSFTSLTAR